MPVQPETESTDDADVADKPRRLTLAGALAQRERTSAFTGSRIQVDGLVLEVVEIGPYTEQDGRIVTFRARAVGNVRLQAGEILTTPLGCLPDRELILHSDGCRAGRRVAVRHTGCEADAAFVFDDEKACLALGRRDVLACPRAWKTSPACS